jgi:acetate kinase
MKTPTNSILTLNGGSSSIKFSFYEKEGSLQQLFYGEMENIGLDNTRISCINRVTGEKYAAGVKAVDHAAAATVIIDWLERQDGFGAVKAIGHRIVQGMTHTHPELITDGLLDALKKVSAWDPEHMPREMQLIAAFRARYPAAVQIACFDTFFHAAMPLVAKWVTIPRRYFAKGIQRYGFHGLSYAYLLEELERVSGRETAKGRIILAHLGSGASLAAVKEGKSMDTSMGFTPASGLPMSTRTGDLDPGVAWYVMETEKLDPAAFSHLVNHESGLLGISETSPDMRELLKIKDTDSRAAETIDLFCYQARKWIGSFTTVLGGVDTLVFSGGIGENSPEIRHRICENLEFLGVELDPGKNATNEAIISSGTGKVSVRVMKTNEEVMIARLVCQVLDY